MKRFYGGETGEDMTDEGRSLHVSDWVLRRREDDDYQEDEEKLDLGKFEGDWTEKEK